MYTISLYKSVCYTNQPGNELRFSTFRSLSFGSTQCQMQHHQKYWIRGATLYPQSEICSISLNTKFLEVTLLLHFLSLHQMTPLHVAAEQGGRNNIMKYLISRGADIDSTDNYGVNKFLIILSTPNSLLS